MTRLPSAAVVKALIRAAVEAGARIGRVDIRADGVTIWPPDESATSPIAKTPFDVWNEQDNHRASRSGRH